MPLAAGARLGAYEVLSLIGTGGMGEVYKARDTRLDRIVAVKILSEEFARDANRRARFEREAHAVAALNHPHICQLFDVGETHDPHSLSPDPLRFLVMELLEGQTLEERLVRGPLSMPEVLRIATELADALDHAHRRGLIHRDLKPGNVMLTRTGTGSAGSPQAKLLDFGISKQRRAPDLMSLPTVTAGAAPITVEGTVVGTYPYMAPEQLAGRETDARSDIFAFGAIVYEMATGRRAFEGTTAATVIGAILHKDPPPVSSLQTLAPPGLDRLLSRALAKDPDDRWQTMRDLTLELKFIAEDSSSAGAASRERPTRRKWSSLIPAALTMVAVAVGVVAVAYLRRAPAESPVVRLPFSPPDGLTMANLGRRGSIVVSPDGRRLAFAATGPDGKQALWIRALDSLEAQPLPETDGGAFPFWDPDSRSLGFFAQGKLKKIQIAGGPPQTLCDAVQPRGGTWGASDTIVFSAGAGYELYSVPAGSGGVATAIAADGINQERARPWFLPDGRHFLYYGRPQSLGIYVASIDSPGATLLLKDHVGAAYVSGYLMSLKGTSSGSASMTLLAQPFDAAQRELHGAPEAVASQIYYDSLQALGEFSASQTGTLVYGTVSLVATQLTWFDRGGKVIGAVGAPGAFSQPALSPNERTIAVQRVDPETQDTDLWAIDTARRLETRVTSAGNINFDPVWSPNGLELAFASARLGPPNVFVKRIGAETETRLFESNLVSQTTDWSRDGRYIIYASQHPKTGWDLMRFPVTAVGADRKPLPVLQTAYNEHWGRVSPDGRLIAFMSDESGTMDVYVQGFESADGKRRVSNAGGREPVWRGDGRELFYIADDDTVTAVGINSSGEPGSAIPLFKTHLSRTLPNLLSYAVSRDGARFLIDTITSDAPSVPTRIVFNWASALGR